MESIQEFIPFAKEMLSQRPSKGMLRVYLVGSVFAVLGTVIGLVDLVCHPSSAEEPIDEEMLQLMAREEKRVIEQRKQRADSQEMEVAALAKTRTVSQRSLAYRLHAS